MISNFIIAFLGTALFVLALTLFVTLGENIDWGAVRLIIGMFGSLMGFMGVILSAENISLWGLITKRKK